MKAIYLLNSFSLNMLDFDRAAKLDIRRIDISQAIGIVHTCGFTSAVGHESTAKILTEMLGTEVPCNRTTVKLQSGDIALVAQYIGPRLPEGATELPPGAKIEFFGVDYYL